MHKLGEAALDRASVGPLSKYPNALHQRALDPEHSENSSFHGGYLNSTHLGLNLDLKIVIFFWGGIIFEGDTAYAAGWVCSEVQ